MRLNKKILSILFIYTLSFSLKAQINFDNDCIFKNSAKASQEFINAVGPAPIIYIIENDMFSLTQWKVDIDGYVISLNKVLGMPNKRDYFVGAFLPILEEYLIKNKVQFYICYEKPQKIETVEEAAKRIREEITCADYPKTITLTIPGQFMNYYEIEKEKIFEQTGKKLTKYEYLQQQIKKHLEKE